MQNVVLNLHYQIYLKEYQYFNRVIVGWENANLKLIKNEIALKRKVYTNITDLNEAE